MFFGRLFLRQFWSPTNNIPILAHKTVFDWPTNKIRATIVPDYLNTK